MALIRQVPWKRIHVRRLATYQVQLNWDRKFANSWGTGHQVPKLNLYTILIISIVYRPAKGSNAIKLTTNFQAGVWREQVSVRRHRREKCGFRQSWDGDSGVLAGRARVSVPGKAGHQETNPVRLGSRDRPRQRSWSGAYIWICPRRCPHPKRQLG